MDWSFLKTGSKTLLLMTTLSFSSVFCQQTEAYIECDDIDLRCFNNGSCPDMNATSCDCSTTRYFTGRDCLRLDLNIPAKDVYENGIIFKWKEDIYLKNYWVLYARNPPHSRSTIRRWEIPANWTSEVNVNGMKPNALEYLLCISHATELGNLTDKKIVRNVLNSTSPNCGIVVTAFDNEGAFSLAFIGIAAALGSVVIILLVIQTVQRCRNQELREEILKDVMGTLDRLRHPSRMNKGKDDQKTLSGVDNKTFTDNTDFSSRVSGPHSDPSVRA